MNPADPKAESITFGVELETTIRANCDLSAGAYHNGLRVRSALDRTSRNPVYARA